MAWSRRSMRAACGAAVLVAIGCVGVGSAVGTPLPPVSPQAPANGGAFVTEWIDRGAFPIDELVPNDRLKDEALFSTLFEYGATLRQTLGVVADAMDAIDDLLAGQGGFISESMTADIIDGMTLIAGAASAFGHTSLAAFQPNVVVAKPTLAVLLGLGLLALVRVRRAFRW